MASVFLLGVKNLEHENILKMIMVMDAQLWEYTKSH